MPDSVELDLSFDFLELLPLSFLEFSKTLLNWEESQHIQNIEASHRQRFELGQYDTRSIVDSLTIFPMR